MRACIQRVGRACVRGDQQVVGQISNGLLALLGVAAGDSPDDAQYLADKTAKLRVFEDADGKMNEALIDGRGQLLVVSQFTLLGDGRRGRRPSFTGAAHPDLAIALYEEYVQVGRGMGVAVECGQFRAHMQVESVNDGPVTILLDSRKLF